VLNVSLNKFSSVFSNGWGHFPPTRRETALFTLHAFCNRAQASLAHALPAVAMRKGLRCCCNNAWCRFNRLPGILLHKSILFIFKL
jgi:hypothetical protein